MPLLQPAPGNEGRLFVPRRMLLAESDEASQGAAGGDEGREKEER